MPPNGHKGRVRPRALIVADCLRQKLVATKTAEPQSQGHRCAHIAFLFILSASYMVHGSYPLLPELFKFLYHCMNSNPLTQCVSCLMPSERGRPCTQGNTRPRRRGSGSSAKSCTCQPPTPSQPTPHKTDNNLPTPLVLSPPPSHPPSSGPRGRTPLPPSQSAAGTGRLAVTPQEYSPPTSLTADSRHAMTVTPRTQGSVNYARPPPLLIDPDLKIGGPL